MTTKIEFIGDPTCPFCYLGYSRFALARLEFDADVLDVSISPFFINPDLPSNGLEYQQYLLARFGDQKTIAAELVPFLKGCEEDKIPLGLDKIKVMPNTLNAQRLIHWAAEIGADEELFRALQTAHFVGGFDIGNDAVLRARAEAIGMDGRTIMNMFATDRDEVNIKETYKDFLKHGLKEVPTWVIGGTYVVTGVQSFSFWRNVIGEIDEKGRDNARRNLN